METTVGEVLYFQVLELLGSQHTQCRNVQICWHKSSFT